MLNNKSKNNQSGITLVALAVSIVILLILASVTANAITGKEGLFSKSNEIAGKYNTSVQEEEDDVNYMNTLMGKYRKNKKINNTIEIEQSEIETSGILTINCIEMSEPANGSEYTLGEQIDLKIIIANSGNSTITDIYGYCGLLEVEWNINSLAPGTICEYNYSHEVTEDDIINYGALIVIELDGTCPDIDDDVYEFNEFLYECEEPNGYIVCSNIESSEPANGYQYELDEEIDYYIIITNTGNLTITDITVSDELTGDEWTIESLRPGESRELDACTTVREDDTLAGEVVNIVTARGTSPDSDHPDCLIEPGEVRSNCGSPNGELTVYCEETSTPANGNAYQLGETIYYKVVAKNTGNLTITDIWVSSELTEAGWGIDSLAPGASKDFTDDYWIHSLNYIENGRVINVVTATGTSPDPDNPDCYSESDECISYVEE